MIYKKDGDKICCHRNDFKNLRESMAGFGDTEDGALADFLRQGGVKDEGDTVESLKKKYHSVKLRFHHYYKFDFWFYGETDSGTEVKVCSGGNSEDIYRFEVYPDMDVKIEDLEPYCIVAEENKIVIHSANSY